MFSQMNAPMTVAPHQIAEAAVVYSNKVSSPVQAGNSHPLSLDAPAESIMSTPSPAVITSNPGTTPFDPNMFRSVFLNCL